MQQDPSLDHPGHLVFLDLGGWIEFRPFRLFRIQGLALNPKSLNPKPLWFRAFGEDVLLAS